MEHLFKIINMLRDRGVGIIYISHKMAEIKRISDEITIMRDGTWVATRPAAELEMQDIIRLMVGRELTNQFPPKTNTPGETYLEVKNLTAQYSLLKDVSFEAAAGRNSGPGRSGRQRPYRDAGEHLRRGYPQVRHHHVGRQTLPQPQRPGVY